MPTLIRYDLTHTLLKKIQEEQTVKGESEIHQFAEDSVGEPISDLELVSHLDYLNQKGYIHAVFTGQPYDNVNPMPALSTFKKASLTERGSKLLEKMEAHCSQSDR